MVEGAAGVGALHGESGELRVANPEAVLGDGGAAAEGGGSGEEIQEWVGQRVVFGASEGEEAVGLLIEVETFDLLDVVHAHVGGFERHPPRKLPLDTDLPLLV